MQPNGLPEINPVGEQSGQPAGREMLAPIPIQAPVPPPEKANRSWVEASIIVALLLLGMVVIFFTIQWVQPGMLNLALRILLMLVGGVLPVLIYTSFVRNRLPTLFVEYKQNLRRLGFPEYLELYQKKFEEIYGRNPERDRLTAAALVERISGHRRHAAFGLWLVYRLFPLQRSRHTHPK